MKCGYCGENIAGDAGVTVYARGKSAVNFCSSVCMSKAFKELTRVIKKMGPKEKAIFFGRENKKDGKQHAEP